MPLSLSFDHRVVDGADAALFMNEIKAYLEDPDRIMMDE
jgi:pyruvate dehydrogenase E2 component (dihydrolipoamide acetyltransferase)